MQRSNNLHGSLAAEALPTLERVMLALPPVAAHPVQFTVEFRRKMAALPYEQRQEWLSSLASRMRATLAESSDSVAAQELREVARGCRLRLVEAVEHQLGPFKQEHLRALLEVPRERFVGAEDIERSALDIPLPLDSSGHATISAPHAYLLSYRLLGLSEGDRLVELGTGSGYGAALAAFIVGPRGHVLTFEIDKELVAWARRLLASEPNVTLVEGDAVQSAPQWQGASKVAVTFAVEALPKAWLDALPEGALLVAPVGPWDRDQRLVLAERRQGKLIQSDHGAVRYVKNRSGL